MQTYRTNHAGLKKQPKLKLKRVRMMWKITEHAQDAAKDFTASARVRIAIRAYLINRQDTLRNRQIRGAS